jgi:hypothetical protein
MDQDKSGGRISLENGRNTTGSDFAQIYLKPLGRKDSGNQMLVFTSEGEQVSGRTLTNLHSKNASQS